MTDPDTKIMIDKVATRMASENGIEFEKLMKERQQSDPKFSFLFPNNKWHDYYEWKKQEIKRTSLLTSNEIQQLDQILSSLDGSRDCIKNGCFWILQHKKAISQVCNKIQDFMIKSIPNNDFNKRLFICYVINDVLHEVMSDRPQTSNDDIDMKTSSNSKTDLSNTNTNRNRNTNTNDESLDLVSVSLFSMLLQILPNCYQNSQNTGNQSKLESLLQLWQNRKIFSSDRTTKLRNAMINTPINLNQQQHQHQHQQQQNSTSQRSTIPQIQISQLQQITQMSQLSQVNPITQAAQAAQAAQVAQAVQAAAQAKANAMQNALASLNPAAAAHAQVHLKQLKPKLTFNQGLPIPGHNIPIPNTHTNVNASTTPFGVNSGNVSNVSSVSNVGVPVNVNVNVPGTRSHISMPSFPTPVSSGITALTPFPKDSFGISIGLITEIALELRRTGKGGIYVPIPIDKLPPFRKGKDETVLEQERIQKNIPQLYETYRTNLKKIIKAAPK